VAVHGPSWKRLARTAAIRPTTGVPSMVVSGAMRTACPLTTHAASVKDSIRPWNSVTSGSRAAGRSMTISSATSAPSESRRTAVTRAQAPTSAGPPRLSITVSAVTSTVSPPTCQESWPIWEIEPENCSLITRGWVGVAVAVEVALGVRVRVRVRVEVGSAVDVQVREGVGDAVSGGIGVLVGSAVWLRRDGRGRTDRRVRRPRLGLDG